MRCAEKIAYATEAKAERARKTALKIRNRGKALRWLHVYHCPECLAWHVGHQRKPAAPRKLAAPAPHIPSTGDLRRRLSRIERQWDRQLRHKAAMLGKLVEADRLMIETENEMRLLQRQVAAMFLPAR